MLKTRVIPTLLYKDFGLVKGKQFDTQRSIGNAVQAIAVYERRDVDELVFLDVAATVRGQRPDFGLIDDLADACFMPLTVGGGVRTVDDFERLLSVGADKVCVGSASLENSSLIEAAARQFGSQCVVVAVDWRSGGGGNDEPRVWIRSGTKETHLDPVEAAQRLEASGAGEIIATAIERDGMMNGYDLDTLSRLARAVSIPVVASGGAGTYQHLLDVIVNAGVDAVAASSMFKFTEQTPREAKVYLAQRGVTVRRSHER